MKFLSILCLTFSLAFVPLAVKATTQSNLTAIKKVTMDEDESIIKNYESLLQTATDPIAITSFVNQNISKVNNESAFMMVKGIVGSLKGYKQVLYQKLDNQLIQTTLVNQFPKTIEKSDLKDIQNINIRHLLTNDVYDKGFTVNLIRGHYLPVINEKNLEKYYIFLTPAQIQHIKVLLML